MKLGKEQKLEQLEKVLHSRTLQNSESLKAFLRFVVEKTVDDENVLLKEYTIATEVFGRNSEYDPRIDSVVRVQAGRLRTKLHEYYTTEGKGDQIVIDLPKGHYHPVFNCPDTESLHETSPGATHTTEGNDSNGHAATAVADGHSQVDSIHRPRKGRVVLLLLCGLVVLLGAAVLILYFSNRELRRQATESADPSLNTEEFKAVWSPFINDPEAPLLVLSNPTSLPFPERGRPRLGGRASHPINSRADTRTGGIAGI